MISEKRNANVEMLICHNHNILRSCSAVSKRRCTSTFPASEVAWGTRHRRGRAPHHKMRVAGMHLGLPATDRPVKNGLVRPRRTIHCRAALTLHVPGGSCVRRTADFLSVAPIKRMGLRVCTNEPPPTSPDSLCGTYQTYVITGLLACEQEPSSGDGDPPMPGSSRA